MRRWWPTRSPAGLTREPRPFEDPRWRLPHPIAVLTIDRTLDRRTLLGYAENMSRGGMMIGTISPKAVGSRHRVEFALPGPSDVVVRCSCRVAWARPFSVDPERPGMGLELLDLPESVAAAIDALWENGRRPEAPACRTWSEFDRAWIPWTPRIAAPRDVSS